MDSSPSETRLGQREMITTYGTSGRVFTGLPG